MSEEMLVVLPGPGECAEREANGRICGQPTVGLSGYGAAYCDGHLSVRL